jgi:hypothetical protein
MRTSTGAVAETPPADVEHLWSPAGAIGGNRWQMGHPRKPLKQADPQPVATHGNRSGAHGKEGVDGSSPSEGFPKFLLITSFHRRSWWRLRGAASTERPRADAKAAGARADHLSAWEVVRANRPRRLRLVRFRVDEAAFVGGDDELDAVAGRSFCRRSAFPAFAARRLRCGSAGRCASGVAGKLSSGAAARSGPARMNAT